MLAIPGGKLDEGEDPLMCVVREVREEIGLNIHPSQFKFITDLKYPWGASGRYFRVVLSEKPKIQQNEGKMEWHSTLVEQELATGQNQIWNAVVASS